MALPPDTSDSAPFTKRKKKKKKSQRVEEEKDNVIEIGDEERTRGDEEKTQGDEEKTQGDEEKTQGSNHVKKKKRRHEETRGEERKRGNEEEEVMRKKKKRKVNGMQPEDGSQGDEAGGKKTKRKENVTQPDVIIRGDDMTRRKKKKRKKGKTSETEADWEFSRSDIMEMEEFLPNFRKKSLKIKRFHRKYDLPRFREFKRKGLKLRWGVFSQEEKLQIRRNVDNFMKLTGIQATEELFFPQRFPDQEKHLKNLKYEHRFYLLLAEDLLRTIVQVYMCARGMFDSRNHKGSFSEAEVTALEKLQTIHGNNWKIIGNKLERSTNACQKRYVALSTCRGPWTEDELQRLKDAAQKHLKRVLKSSPDSDSGLSLVQLCSKLPWTKIKQKVQTRNWLQCRFKWFRYLRSRIKAGQPKLIHEAGSETRIRLIRALYELQVEEISDVDWIEVAKTVGPVTPICVQQLFHRLKVSRIPSWTQKSFGEIVDHLFEKELPQLQKKLQCVPGPEPGPEPGPAQFSLDQLFPTELEDFKEQDNTT